MGKLDIQTRAYVRDNEIFADICNYKLFQGKRVILPEQLKEKDPVELIIPFKEENITIPIQKFRDLMKKVDVKEANNVTYMIVGVENQQEIHYAMVIRNMLYDAIDYASQINEISKRNRKGKVLKDAGEFLSGIKKDDKIIPVVTIVIYWGANEWDGVKSLHELLDVDSRVLEYIPNYRINLIAPSEIDDFDRFHTEFGLIMECLKNSENSDSLRQMLKEKKDRFSKMQKNAANLISELTKIKIDINNEKDEVIDMCKAIEDMMEESRMQGTEIGKEIGKEIDRVELIRNNMDELSIDMIAKILRVEESYVSQIITLISQFSDEDDEQIAKRHMKI